MNKGTGKPEATVLKECLLILKQLKIYHWRQNTGSFKTQNGGFFRSSMAGVSDILGIMPDGRFLAVECKREKGGIVSPAQKDFLQMIANNGGVAIVTHDARELKTAIESEMKK